MASMNKTTGFAATRSLKRLCGTHACSSRHAWKQSIMGHRVHENPPCFYEGNDLKWLQMASNGSVPVINFPAEQRYESDDNMGSSPHKLSKIGLF